MSGKELDTPRQMIAKARIKIDSAQILLINGNYDDSVSRSYYAVFFAVSAALYSKGLSFSSHSQAIGAFNREFVKTGIFPPTFTKMIKLMFNERQTGDYDFDSWIDEEIAQEGIDNAKLIVSEIDRYLDTAAI